MTPRTGPHRFVHCTGFSASKVHQNILFFPFFCPLLCIFSGLRGTRGTHSAGRPCGAGNSVCSSRSCGARRTSRASGSGGTAGPHRKQQGKVRRLPRDPPGIVGIHPIKVPLIRHHLSGGVGFAGHKRHRRRSSGREGRRTHRRTGRRALGRVPARLARPTLRQSKVAAFVTLHTASFLRLKGGHMQLRVVSPQFTLCVPALFAPFPLPLKKSCGADRGKVVYYAGKE